MRQDPKRQAGYHGYQILKHWLTDGVYGLPDDVLNNLVRVYCQRANELGTALVELDVRAAVVTLAERCNLHRPEPAAVVKSHARRRPTYS